MGDSIEVREKTSQGNGHVTMNEKVPTEKFTRFVSAQVSSWIAQNQGDDQLSEYEVAFFDEETLGEVSCLVVIHCAGRLWRAWETGDDAQVALSRSLEHLAVDDEATVGELAMTTSSAIH